jgi:DNA-directed RNA polymerase subunit RPC12/RpoP
LDLEESFLEGFAKALDVPADDSLRAYVRTGRAAPRGSAKLLAWDANSIHAFVFDTTNATGIRGASDLLSGIDAVLRDGRSLGLRRGQVLFAGGGSGLAVVAEGEVEPCLRRLHQIFAERTVIATCTAAAVNLLEDGQGFDERVRAVGRALARARILTGPDAEPAVPFFVERCQVCGRRAAASRPLRGESRTPRFECQPCSSRIEHGKTMVRSKDEPVGFEDIADHEGKGFYAVVYLDGKGIGKTINRLPSPLDYATFSRSIEGVLRGSFDQVADRYGLRKDSEDRQSKGRYQRPICGGDDVVVILPGEVAVPFTRDLLKQVEQAADSDPVLSGKMIGASAGVAIGHVKFPIRHLVSEAEALLALAKRRAYAEPEPRSTLSFAVVTDGSPRSETVEPPRWGAGPNDLLLSGRPYTLDELGTFSERFRVVRNGKVGRSQLYALHNHAMRGPQQLRNHVLYQIGRREEWADLAVELGGGDRDVLRDPEACMAQFAPDYGGRRVFDMADMIDLLRHWPEDEENAAP